MRSPLLAASWLSRSRARRSRRPATPGPIRAWSTRTRPAQPRPANAGRARPAGEDSHADADCGGKSGSRPASPQPGGAGGRSGRHGDPRADRAHCRKLQRRRHRHRPDRRGAGREPPPRRPSAASRSPTPPPPARSPCATTRASRPASMFYVAYTTGEPNRPVTFLYNGGPGSSTVWLHMGSLGARPCADRQPAAHPQRALPAGRQRRQPARQVRPGVPRRDRRRLLAAARRHQARGLLGHRPGHRRLRARRSSAG